MDAIKAILSRRSIRKYLKKPLPESLAEVLLKCAMSAPSAGNQQPWHFVVIDDKEILSKIPSCHPYAEMVPEAKLAILVCGDLTRDVHKGFWVQDCSAATQNILIAANALGLGAVWLGVYPRESRVEGLKNLLGIPEEIIPFSLIPVGWPAEKKPPSNRYKKTKIHRNHW